MLKQLCAGAVLIAGTTVASAAPLATAPIGQPAIILVAGGCGLGFHPNFYGQCVPNRRFYGYGPGPVVVAPGRLPPPCPRGYHRDPDPARPLCYPNF